MTSSARSPSPPAVESLLCRGKTFFEFVDPVQEVEVELARSGAAVVFDHVAPAIRRAQRRVFRLAREALLVDVDRDHRVETQELKVGEVVPRERLSAQVSHDAAKTPESPGPAAHALEVGEFDPEGIADRHVLDRASSGNQRAHLTSGIARNRRELPCELLRNQPVARDSALVQVSELAQLTGLEAVCPTV
ncbi:MAG: hypothetical protein VX614_08105 [Myxococcota bacterium]|nr:hypothetical protein [Myxococcota bacterium]